MIDFMTEDDTKLSSAVNTLEGREAKAFAVRAHTANQLYVKDNPLTKAYITT